MYVFKRQVTMQRGIATLLAIALVFWAVGVHMFDGVRKAQAANLISISDTLSDSNPSSGSNHTIQFRSPNGVAAGQTITVAFPAGFTSTSSINEDDVDFLIDGVDETVVDGAPGAAEWGLTWSGNTLTLTAGASESLTGTTSSATILIGLHADTGGAGAAQITNPSATTSYEFTVTAGPSDSGQFRVAIIENVLVTANINTTFSFIVYGTTTGAVCNGSDPTFGPSTNTTLPFGTLNAGVPKTLCQDLTVATNARNGYVVTVMQDNDLRSSTLADIDGFTDGSYTNTPTAWVAPGNSISNENTWGHWGLTSSDATTSRTAQFGSDQWVAASTTPIIIMGHTGPADASTDGIGRASIGYQVEITALQEAGDDYNTTLTYVATPTF